ncbi:MAG: isoprenyl transferase [Desulfobacteraceae bacterium]|nr:isoprenyl transferase [Desulfobacteraceae bacterium]
MSSKTTKIGEPVLAELPRHVAIIMDGNGRWAKKRLLNRVKGHEKGAETVRRIVRTCRELNIPVLTLYAFSTENWQRPATEVKALMALLKKFLIEEELELKQNNIRLNIIGQFQRLPEDVRKTIERVKSSTASNDGLLLNLALSYGGRTEITEMVQTVAAKAASGQLNPATIDEALISDHLYTRGMPDPDIMIRTSGEMRISNFLLWQLAYAEIFVTPTLWPDFTPEEFISILKSFQQRDRRFGKVDS